MEIQKLKSRAPLIAAITAPILMIVIVALSVNLPKLWAKPQYDFVYSATEYRTPIYAPNPGVPASSWATQYYYYDLQNNSSKKISEDDFKKLNVIDSVESPDGFTVQRGGQDSFLPFGSNYSQFFLHGHQLSERLNIDLTSTNYDYHFVGWVKR